MYALTLFTSLLFVCYFLLFNKHEYINLNRFDFLVVGGYVFELIRLTFTKDTNIDNFYFLNSTALIVFYFILKFLILNKQVEVLINALFIFTIAESIFALLQFFNVTNSYNPNFSITGTFINPAPLAGFLISSIPLAIAIIIKPNHEWPNVSKKIALVLLMVSLPLIILLDSRASLVACIAGVIYILYNLYKDRITQHYLGILKLSIVALLSALIVGLFLIRPDSALGRLFIWENTVKIISENFFWGTGYDTFNVAYSSYQVDYFIHHPEISKEYFLADSNDFAFNDFLKLFSEQGVIAFFIFMAVLYFVFSKREVDPKNKLINIAITGCVLSILIFAFFSYPFSILPIQINYIFFISIISCISSQVEVRIKISEIYTKALLLLISLLILYFSFALYNHWKSYHQWKQAQNFKAINRPVKAKNIYEDIYPMLKNDGQFLFEYGTLLFDFKEYQKCIVIMEEAKKKKSDLYLYTTLGMAYQRAENYKMAEKNYFYASKLIPHLIYPNYLLVKLYDESGDEKKASIIAKKVLNMQSKISNPIGIEMKKEMQNYIK